MLRIPTDETRTAEELIEHYELETRLAEKLRNASKEERKILYTSLYEELHTKIPYYQTKRSNLGKRDKAVKSQMSFISRFSSPEITFLEIGPGDCALSLEACKFFKKVYAFDVHNQIRKDADIPSNFEFSISEIASVTVPQGTIDIAYSNQLMEHLHPEDALEHLQGIFNALAPGGIYIVITPHRFIGPHDISAIYDEIARGFHLKEYTNSELYRLFRAAGFSKVCSYTLIKGHYRRIPVFPSILLEGIMSLISYRVKKWLFMKRGIRNLLPIRMVAQKGPHLS